jgi:hypothetical protein
METIRCMSSGVSLEAPEVKTATGGRNVLVKFVIIFVALKVGFTAGVTIVGNKISVEFTTFIFVLVEIGIATELIAVIGENIFVKFPETSVVVRIGTTTKLVTVLDRALIARECNAGYAVGWQGVTERTRCKR